jgi:hypothetical protein
MRALAKFGAIFDSRGTRTLSRETRNQEPCGLSRVASVSASARYGEQTQAPSKEAPERRHHMLKATKLTLAALFVAGSCGLAIAQGTSGAGSGAGAADSGGVSTDKPANKDTIGTSKQQSTAPAGGAKMQQKATGMQPKGPANAGPNETGTAKDTAGSGTQRDPKKQ